MANELRLEDSPYLKQHSNNPVSWVAWSEDVFKRAEKEDKLIFLSIGYSTCHWCHVMEKESFEDDGVANILNEKFISIKVDREEMPDVDKYYQDIHYLVNRRGGGWPLSVILLPDSKAVFAGTYIPKENRGQMMGFKNLLLLVDEKYRTQKQEVLDIAKNIEDIHTKYENSSRKFVKISDTVVEDFVQNIKKNFDDVNKGIGGAPKFPHASTFHELLRIYTLTSNKEAFSMAKETLDFIRRGGINDQIEGGFYRYSVDSGWKIPHFEKMLYTNAELLSSYALLYKIEKNEDIKEVVKDTIKAMDERFLYDGLYFSASDADSEGEEGKYFVFGYKEAKEALEDANISPKEADDILYYLDITKSGNFENQSSNPNVLTDKKPPKLQIAKEILKDVRQKVAYPFIDKKILTSWNALFISALFDVGEMVDKTYTNVAQKSLDKLLDTLYKNGKLYHQILPNSTLKVEGLLEDYAFLSETLLKAFGATQNEAYLTLAKSLIQRANEKFYKNGRWYLGGFKATAPLEDNAYKSPLTSMLSSMATLALYSEDNKMFLEAKKMFDLNSANFASYAYSSALFVWMQLYKKQTLIKVPKDEYESVAGEIKKLENPLILVKKSNEKVFQACEISSCYAYREDLHEVLKDVKARYEKEF